MQSQNRGIATRGFVLFALAGLLAVSTVGNQGCSIRIDAQPPPPGTGQGAPPAGTPGAPGTTVNPPKVEILVSTTTEVAGYAVDTANVSNAAITVDLLPATAAATTGTTPTAVTPLMTTTANVSDNIPGLIYPGHGFRFQLSGANPQSAVAAGQSVVARGNNGGQIGTSAPATLTAPTGTVTSTTPAAPTGTVTTTTTTTNVSPTTGTTTTAAP